MSLYKEIDILVSTYDLGHILKYIEDIIREHFDSISQCTHELAFLLYEPSHRKLMYRLAKYYGLQIHRFTMCDYSTIPPSGNWRIRLVNIVLYANKNITLPEPLYNSYELKHNNAENNNNIYHTLVEYGHSDETYGGKAMINIHDSDINGSFHPHVIPQIMNKLPLPKHIINLLTNLS